MTVPSRRKGKDAIIRKGQGVSLILISYLNLNRLTVDKPNDIISPGGSDGVEISP